jgi:hypothetical protein
MTATHRPDSRPRARRRRFTDQEIKELRAKVAGIRDVEAWASAAKAEFYAGALSGS